MTHRIIWRMKRSWLAASLTLLAFPLHAELLVDSLRAGYGESHLITVTERGSLVWSALIDTGGAEAYPAIEEGLRRRGVHKLHAVFISHAHPNHSGGLGKFPPGRTAEIYWTGALEEGEGLKERLAALEASGTVVKPLKAGWSLMPQPSLRLKVLHPQKLNGTPHQDNLVLELDYGRTVFIFAGDLSVDGQSKLVLPKADMVTWPHHGDELAPPWAKAFETTPYLIVSVGPNSLHLPQTGKHRPLWSKALRTDLGDGVTLYSDGLQVRRR